MNKAHRNLNILLLVAALAGVVYTTVLAQGGDSQPAGALPEEGAAGSDSRPSGPPEIVIPDKYQPKATDASIQAPGRATVYFTPQDENTSTTVIFLYNTRRATATVGIQTFELDGALYIDTAVDVPGHGLVRICGDEVSTVSWTWQDVVLINFTTASTYGKLELPDRVKAEAYVVWNGGAQYDPLQVVPTLSIRFSSDPPSVFLPLTSKQ